MLCAKSYTIKKYRPTAKAIAAAAAAAAAMSHAATCSPPPLLGMGVHVGVDPGIPQCRHSGDNSCSVSNDKAQVCGLWDARPIVVVVVAQRPIPIDWSYIVLAAS